MSHQIHHTQLMASRNGWCVLSVTSLYSEPKMIVPWLLHWFSGFKTFPLAQMLFIFALSFLFWNPIAGHCLKMYWSPRQPKNSTLKQWRRRIFLWASQQEHGLQCLTHWSPLQKVVPMRDKDWGVGENNCGFISYFVEQVLNGWGRCKGKNLCLAMTLKSGWSQSLA